jgi:hypothetical protein
MATLRLNRGNYFFYGYKLADGQYQEIFAKVEDYSTNDGNTWLKVKLLANMFTRELEDATIRLNARDDLGNAVKLDIFTPERGLEIYADIKRIFSRENQPPESLRPVVETLPEVDPPQVQVAEERVVIEPTFPEEIEHELQINTDVFSINLSSGDMKTINAIAEKKPEKVFPIIDKAVQEHGHILLTYIQGDLRRDFIDLKINKCLITDTIQIRPGETYEFKRVNEKMYAKFIGAGNLWFIKKINGFSEFQDNFVFLNPEHLLNVNAQKIEIPMDDRIQDLSNEVQSNIEYDNSPFTLEILLTEKNSKVKAEMLGAKWEKLIIYNYFLGGTLDWDLIDINTFKEKSALKKLAVVKKDTNLLEKLDEV